MSEKRERRESSALHLKTPPAPHMVGRKETRALMLDVLIALVPALLISGLYFFGYRVFLVTAVSIAGCVGFECLYCLLTGQKQTIGDLSAAVTGVLLAFCLPANIPLWTVLVGDFFAIVIVKELFGGMGKNFMNPALAGRVFLFSFPALMSAFPAVRDWEGFAVGVDGISAATPMAALHNGMLPNFTVQELFTGVRGGSLGEVSAALLLLGGAYLVLRGVVGIRIPLCFLGTVAALTYFFPVAGVNPVQWMMYQLLSGGLILGAVFMATDYATSPVTKGGQIVYGVGCGLLTVFLRYYGSYPEGVAFAILIMNACAWAIDKVFRPRRYGVSRFEKGGGGK